MHSITVTLSEAAQRAAILAGEPAAKTQTYVVKAGDLLALLVLPWTRVDGAGIASCVVPERIGYDESGLLNWTSTYGYGYVSGVADRFRPDNAAQAICHAEGIRVAYLAKCAEMSDRKAQQEAAHLAKCASQRSACEAWAALPLPERLAGASPVWPGFDSPASYTAARHEVAAEQQRLRDAPRIAEERAALEALGTPSQRERFEAGVLPSEEMTALLREHYLAPYLPSALTRIKAEDLPSDEPCSGDEGDNHPGVVVTRTEPLTALSEAQWAALQAARALSSDLAAQGSSIAVEAVVDRIECSERRCSAGVDARRIRVTLTLPSGRTLKGRCDL